MSLKLTQISGSPIATNGFLLNEDVGCFMFPCGQLCVLSIPIGLYIHKPFQQPAYNPGSFPDFACVHFTQRSQWSAKLCRAVWAQVHGIIFSISCKILILPLGNGTIDYVPYISASCALDFREWIGREEVINAYCNRIALEGGRRLASILGTEIIDQTQGYEFTLNMVRLPVFAWLTCFYCLHRWMSLSHSRLTFPPISPSIWLSARNSWSRRKFFLRFSITMASGGLGVVHRFVQVFPHKWTAC